MSEIVLNATGALLKVARSASVTVAATPCAPVSQQPLQIVTFTTLYANSVTPNHGIFTETSLRHQLGSGALHAVVVAPVPWFPFGSRLFSRYTGYAGIPDFEVLNGVEV